MAIRKTQPDLAKARSLLQSANTTHQRLKETDIEKYPSNALVDYYDIIHKLLEAIALTEGIKTRGEGAHKTLIQYICKKYCSEQQKAQVQELREYQNKINYEGMIIKTHYITANKPLYEQIIRELKNRITS